jgi:predicted CopG family antitoxin
MGFKTIGISDEAYRKLQKLKGKSESLTDVILRLSDARGDFMRHVGAWGDMTDKEAEDLLRMLRDMWAEWKPERSA